MLRFEVDIEKFRSDFTLFAERAVREIRKAQVGEARDFTRRVQNRTPVRTGRLRNSIHLVEFGSGGTYAYTDNQGKAFDGSLSSEPLSENEILVGTNVPYALLVEGGSSEKAPEGMFSVTEVEKAVELRDRYDQVLREAWQT